MGLDVPAGVFNNISLGHLTHGTQHLGQSSGCVDEDTARFVLFQGPQAWSNPGLQQTHLLLFVADFFATIKTLKIIVALSMTVNSHLIFVL